MKKKKRKKRKEKKYQLNRPFTWAFIFPFTFMSLLMLPPSSTTYLYYLFESKNVRALSIDVPLNNIHKNFFYFLCFRACTLCTQFVLQSINVEFLSHMVLH